MGSSQESKTIRVLLVCAFGFSTVLLEARITEAAKAAGVNLDIRGDTVDGIPLIDFEKKIFDVILLAPQVRFMRKRIAQRVAPFNIVVQVLDPMAFGMMDGELLFRQILEALQAHEATELSSLS